MRILRLAGGPGVGKSTVAWEVARRLGDEGTPTGYVDIDQLGMCYPAPGGDPDRWHLKERVLQHIARAHEAVGVDLLVVSGVAETRTPPPSHGYPATSIWLDAEESVRRARLAARGWDDGQVGRALQAGTTESTHAHTDWIRLATDRLAAGAVADAVIDRVGSQPGSAAGAATRALRPVSTAAGRVVWLTGPRLAGASTVGWRLVSERWSVGLVTGFADAAQLAFTANDDDHDHGLALAGVAALHEAFAEVQAHEFVVVAPQAITPDAVHLTFPHAEVVIVRLGADEPTRRTRAGERRAACGPRLAGDDVAVATDAEIAALIVDGGVEPREDPDVVVVETSGLELQAAVDAVRRALGGDISSVGDPAP